MTFAMVVGFAYCTLGIVCEAVASVGPMNEYMQYGSLGLLGFMLWVNSKEKQHMIRRMEIRDGEFLTIVKDQAVLTKEAVEAIKVMTAVAKSCKAKTDD